jgi:endonuclease/exonuclease/phosphatase family metal-dependent hydrolase
LGQDLAMSDSAFGPLIDTTTRIVTWNIWWRFGPWEERLPAIIETLRRLDPDIVCLQEVWIDLASGDSSATRIADALGWEQPNLVLFNRADLDGIGFGNAIISRWPIVGSEVLPLYSPEELEEFRTVGRADIEGPRGVLQVFTTHLHWRVDHSAIRQEQVREICEFVRDSPHRTYPAVLTGDFNADPTSDEVRMITGRAAVPAPPVAFFDAWEVAGASPLTDLGHTWSNDNPYARLDLEASRRIDYLFSGFPKQGGLGHAVRAEVVGTEAIDTGLEGGPIVPSDHYGVVADLRY